MKPEDLDIARAGEAWEQFHRAKHPEDLVPSMNDFMGTGHTMIEIAYIAARLAREGWTPVDPDVLAARKICDQISGAGDVAPCYAGGHYDDRLEMKLALAGIRAGRAQSRPAGYKLPESASQPYWLCCGSLDPKHHRHRCSEAKRGHPERCRFGTYAQHVAWDGLP